MINHHVTMVFWAAVRPSLRFGPAAQLLLAVGEGARGSLVASAFAPEIRRGGWKVQRFV